MKRKSRSRRSDEQMEADKKKDRDRKRKCVSDQTEKEIEFCYLREKSVT
jgi:hypothetical protein